jgi:hypothetical protein
MDWTGTNIIPLVTSYRLPMLYFQNNLLNIVEASEEDLSYVGNIIRLIKAIVFF